MSGDANVTRATPAEECCDAWTRPSAMTERAPSNRRRQWKLRDEGFRLARRDGRRVLPPEELRIVPQPRRERPPTWPWRLTPRSDRGGRSRLGCLPAFRFRLGSRFASANALRFSPRTRGPFTALSAGVDVSRVQPEWSADQTVPSPLPTAPLAAGHHVFESGAVLGAVKVLRSAPTPLRGACGP